MPKYYKPSNPFLFLLIIFLDVALFLPFPHSSIPSSFHAYHCHVGLMSHVQDTDPSQKQLAFPSFSSFSLTKGAICVVVILPAWRHCPENSKTHSARAKTVFSGFYKVDTIDKCFFFCFFFSLMNFDLFFVF